MLGLSILAGGLKYKTQRFNVLLAGHNASLMLLAVIALFIPAIAASHLDKAKMNTLMESRPGPKNTPTCFWLWQP